MIWHVQRRWRLFTAPAVLERLTARPPKRGRHWCTWLGYFRANSYVDIAALVAVLEHDLAAATLPTHSTQNTGGNESEARIFGRGMISETHGRETPVINWGGTDLLAAWASSGLLMNRAAVDLMMQVTDHKTVGTFASVYVEKIARWLLSMPLLDELLAGQREVEGGFVACTEMLFSASLRSQNRDLVIRWMPRQSDRFLVGELLLERFIFRLGAAAFDWSRVDLSAAGLDKHGHVDLGFPPQCVFSFYPVDDPALMRVLHGTVPRVACLPCIALPLVHGVGGGTGDSSAPPGVLLRARGVLGRLRVGTAKGRALVQKLSAGQARWFEAMQSPQWRAVLRGNRQAWANFVLGPRHRRGGESWRGRGSFRLAPVVPLHARGHTAPPPDFMHGDEWAYGPAGQLRLRTPITIVASLPNSGTTWFLHALQQAQQTHVGCAAVNSDVLHPSCNSLLTTEIAKIMGTPEDRTWRHIFRAAPPAALDLLMELVTNQLHGKAIWELQHMRQHGANLIGEPVPEHLRWPWRGAVPPRRDATRIRLILSKEIINVFQLVQHVKAHGGIGTYSHVSVVGLYRHRAHTFPMSNSSALLCKSCMLERLARSFEVNRFPRDPPMAGLQRWWRRRARHIGGTSSSCGLVFAHLLVWYSVLRARSSGLAVLDYARLMALDRPGLRLYLNATLPATLKRNPGVVAFSASVFEHRFGDPHAFLRGRERQYEELGVEPFARNVIAEMRRLDPSVDLSLLEQPPHAELHQQ